MQFTQTTKNVLIGLLVLIFVMNISYSSAAQTLRVGFFTIEPHTIVESPETYSGAAVEYFTRIAKLMGIADLRFKELPLAQLVEELEKDTIDVILFLAKNPERESKFRYPETPYYMGQSGVAVTTSSSLQNISAIEDLLPLRIGMLARGYLSPFMRDERLKLDPVSGSTPILQNLKKLFAERIDAVYVPDLAVVQFEARKNGYKDAQIRFLPLPEPPTANYSVFSQRSAALYLSRYEEALQELEQTLPYAQFLQEYIAAASPK